MALWWRTLQFVEDWQPVCHDSLVVVFVFVVNRDDRFLFLREQAGLRRVDEMAPSFFVVG